MEKTRALVIESFDDRPHLADIEIPPLLPTQVLVAVRAASVNAFDWKAADGAFRQGFTYTFPVTVGRDFSGVVVATGPQVTRVRVGDEVFGYLAGQELHRGSFAEHLWLDESEGFIAKPPGIDHVSAACLPLGGVVALRCVQAVRPAPGETLLVVGAPGGVGSYVVQLAAARGAHVIATGQPADDEYLTGLGAAAVLRPEADLVAQVRHEYPGGIAGLVDLVHYQQEFLRHLDVLAPGGRTASLHRGVDEAVLAARGLTGANIGSAPDAALLEQLADLAARGVLRVPLQRTYPLEQAAQALRALKEEHARGKLAIVVSG